jgi:hypothetical protein
MHSAASIDMSATGFGIAVRLASGALPVLTEMKPPARTISSNALRSTTRSLITGKPLARHGSTRMTSPSLNIRM